MTASVDVLPVVREYERSLATVLNAVVMPGVSTYVAALEDRLVEEKVSAPLLLMQSNGGVAGGATIRRAPALTALSGPAAGVVGARDVAAACGISDIITVDIGGTSADICLIKDGRIGLTQRGQVGEWPLPLPMVDMVTIGAGGGSIARVADGTLTVGPQSAGAEPGPAAYGRGGDGGDGHRRPCRAGPPAGEPAGRPHGARRRRCRRAIDRRIAGPLGLTREAAARGILAIVDNNMVGALRIVSVERGHDPRDFTLVPFGGAGPLHGCALAELLGIKRVLIPPAPGVLCADGLLAADLKAEFSRTLPKAGPIDMDAARAIYAELERQADDWLAGRSRCRRRPAVGPRRHCCAITARAARSRSAGSTMRGRGRGGLRRGARSALRLHARSADRAGDAAHRGYRPHAGAAAPDAGRRAGRRSPGTPPVHFAIGERRGAALRSRQRFGAGDRIAGPAIISQLDATTLVLPGWQGEVHPSGAVLPTKMKTIARSLLLLALILCRIRAAAQQAVRVQIDGGNPDLKIDIPAQLYRPAGSVQAPAVAIFHGCGGVGANNTRMAELLKSWGYVALVVDSFSSRGLKDACAAATADPGRCREGASISMPPAQARCRTETLAARLRVTPMAVAWGCCAPSRRMYRQPRVPSGWRAAILVYPDCALADAMGPKLRPRPRRR